MLINIIIKLINLILLLLFNFQFMIAFQA